MAVTPPAFLSLFSPFEWNLSCLLLFSFFFRALLLDAVHVEGEGGKGVELAPTCIFEHAVPPP